MYLQYFAYSSILFYTYRLVLTKLSESFQVVGKCKQTLLDEGTIRTLQEMISMCTTGSLVTEYTKVLINESVVVCTRSERRHNSYTVTYTNTSKPAQVFYGYVEKFFTYSSNVHIAIVRPCEVCPCEILQGLNFPPEIEPVKELLSSDFISVHPAHEQSLIAIPIEYITMQCFDASTTDRSVLTVMLREYDCK